LGEEGYVLFTEAFGGTRVYVAYKMRDDSDVVEALGREVADKLSRAMAPATIRVPLARRERALYWRGKGLSNAKVARKLNITENGVEKLFAREADLPDRPDSARNAAQLDLF
jgi:hypothetical protein